MPYQRKNLALDLVKVHDDRFSSLGGDKYFACVDMKGADGKIYDIDFFMVVQPGQIDRYGNVRSQDQRQTALQPFILDSCRKGLVQQLLDFPFKKIITGFPFEKRSSRMNDVGLHRADREER